MLAFLLVVCVGFAGIGGLVLATRNRLAALSGRIDNAWSQIEVQLQRRADLLPGLVAALGSAGVAVPDETGMLEGAAWATGASGALATARSDVDDAVARLLSRATASGAEGDAAVAHAVREVMEADKQVMYMRQSFNDTVARYNEALAAFPGSLLGPAFGFEPRPALQIDPAARFGSF